MSHEVAIVGAGAAGLATAIFTAARQPTSRVVLLDGARTLGAKILVSGGGRCNVTNAAVTEHDFHGGTPGAIRRILRDFPAADTAAWFAGLGVPLAEEAHGKLFPVAGRARVVLDALLADARARGVDIRAGHRVTAIERTLDGIRLTTSQGHIDARAVVLATGGLALPKSGSDGAGYRFAQAFGHTIVPTTPALVPLVCEEEEWRGLLQGVAHDVTLTVTDGLGGRRRVPGALLWTHFGISGPAALDASRHWLRDRLDGKTPSIHAALAPFSTFEDADAWLRREATARPRALVETALSAVMPASLSSAVVRAAHAADVTLTALPREVRRTLVHRLTDWTLPVRGSRGYAAAEATAGGVDLGEVDTSSMASRLCPGLFLVGEVLDVDGRLGGFNFQWAWSSAHVAARGIDTWLGRYG